MIRGTTPTVRLNVSFDLTGCDEIHVAFYNRKTLIVKEVDPSQLSFEDGKTPVEVKLTQADTLSFKAGTEVEVQIRCREGDTAYATYRQVLVASVADVLEDGEI